MELDFVCERICCGLYPEEHLINMEKVVLVALAWRLNGPSAHDFIEYFVELLPEQDDVETLKTLLSEDARDRASSAVMDYSQVLRLPSSIAFAALVKAIQEVGKERKFLLSPRSSCRSFHACSTEGIVVSTSCQSQCIMPRYRVYFGEVLRLLFHL